MALTLLLTFALLIAFVATLVGLARPRTFARKGAVAPSRRTITLVGVVFMVMVTAAIGALAPAAAPRTVAIQQAPPAPVPTAAVPAPLPTAPSPPAKPVPSAPLPAVAGDSKCAADDLRCLGEAGIIMASALCEREVERLAQYSVKWTDGMLEMKFSRFRWTEKPGGGITFVGDKVQFQNGFGAYAPMVYQCDMTRDASRVLAVRAAKGRL